MALGIKGKNSYLVFALTFMIITFLMYKNLPDGSCPSVSESSIQKDIPGNILSSEPLSKDNLHLKVTILIRDYEDHDNRLVETVGKIRESLGPITILIIADALPYPPIKLNSHKNAKIATLSNDLRHNYSSGCVTDLISTEFVLIIPDAVMVTDWKILKSALPVLRSKGTKSVALSIGDSSLECSSLHVNMKEWTLSYRTNDSSIINDCPYIVGDHGLLLHSKTFKSLAKPFARPFPFTFYIQMRLRGWKTRIAKSVRLNRLAVLYTSPHSGWKRKLAQTERLKSFYQKVGLKREILVSGVSQFYGCTKYTERCFGTVVNDMPQYLFEDRWTPPCCLKALRETAAYVFRILEKYEVRYWLEGGSLLGAARSGDIIPWDYDVDIGVYEEDLVKCPSLLKARSERFVDEKEFVWDKATEGDFYRVQYSETNHLHVDIFPFRSKEGVMTKNTWFATHRQDVEFSEKYLNPLIKIKFAGTEAYAPNSVRKFLEYKFGDGVIENPKYPNYQKPV